MTGSPVALQQEHSAASTIGLQAEREEHTLHAATKRWAITASSPHVVSIIVTPESRIFDIVLASEAFTSCLAAADSDDSVHSQYEIRMCAAAPGQVLLPSGFWVTARFGPVAIADADTVFVPAQEPGARSVEPSVISALQQAHRQGRRIVASRSGTSVLAAAGVLHGRTAAVHWLDSQDLRKRYPEAQFDDRTLYLRDRNIVTTAGSMALTETCIDLIRQDYGAAAAARTAQRMLASLHRTGEAPQHVPSSVPIGNDDFPGLLDWIVAHLPQPLTLAGLSHEARISQRTLARRFQKILGTTPMHWVLGQRIHLARQLLEITREPMDVIAQLTGLGSPGNLRLQFTRYTGVTPQRYRSTFLVERLKNLR